MAAAWNSDALQPLSHVSAAFRVWPSGPCNAANGQGLIAAGMSGSWRGGPALTHTPHAPWVTGQRAIGRGRTRLQPPETHAQRWKNHTERPPPAPTPPSHSPQHPGRTLASRTGFFQENRPQAGRGTALVASITAEVRGLRQTPSAWLVEGGVSASPQPRRASLWLEVLPTGSQFSRDLEPRQTFLFPFMGHSWLWPFSGTGGSPLAVFSMYPFCFPHPRHMAVPRARGQARADLLFRRMRSRSSRCGSAVKTLTLEC